MTKEQLRISKQNRRLAWKHFWPEGNGKAKPRYCLHHKDPSWMHNDIDRYIMWNVDDLIMMSNSEHSSLHNSGKNSPWFGKQSPMFGKHLSEDARKKLSISHSGKHHSNETKKKISISHSGEKNPMFNSNSHWWNNGVEQRYCKECPEGFAPGRLTRHS